VEQQGSGIVLASIVTLGFRFGKIFRFCFPVLYVVIASLHV